MKGAVFAVLALSIALFSGTALAQKKVVVEQFSGSGSDKLRQAVVKAAEKAGADVVSDKKVAAVEADLGLMQTSDAYGAVARELKAGGFISGSVSGKKPKARVIVRDADGNSVGEASYPGANPAKAVAAAEAALAKDLPPLLDKLKGGAGGGAVAEKPKKESKKEEAKKEKEKEKEKEESASTTTASADEEEKPKKKKKKKVEEETASETDTAAATASSDESVSSRADLDASEDDEPSSSGGQWKGIDLFAGVHAYKRDFTYNQNTLGNQQEYHLNAGPAVAVGLDYFFIPYLGVTASGEFSFLLLSEGKNADGDKETYATSSYAFQGGVKGKYNLGPLELQGGITYGVHKYTVDPKDPDDPQAPRVAPVNYSTVRPGVGLRLNLGSAFAILVGAGYLHVLDPGGIKTEYFKDATVLASDAYGGVAFGMPFLRGLEGRVMLDFRRYAYNMNSSPNDDRAAGGAVDQYIGLLIGAGFRPSAR